MAELKSEEELKKELVQEMDGSADMAKVTAIDASRLKHSLKARAADVVDLMTHHVPQVRQMPRKGDGTD